jgi:hypothetical protein
MTTCPYCKEPVQDNALKCPHCQSYIVPTAAPKGSSDSADLVIKFVGVISIILTITGGLIAGLGLTSLSDVRKQSETTAAETRKLLEDVKSQIAKYKDEITKLDVERKNVSNSVNAILVKSYYDRYSSTMDTIKLDQLTENSREFDELQDIVAQIDKIGPSENDELATEVKKIRDALQHYVRQDYIDLVTILEPVNNKSKWKHKLLSISYFQLAQSFAGAPKKILNTEHTKESLRAKATYHADLFRDLIKGQSVTSALAKVFLANILLDSGRPGDSEKARDLFVGANRDAPQLAEANYNFAVYYLKSTDKNEMKALDQLKQAAQKGMLSTKRELDLFDSDHDFDEFRKSKQPEIQAFLQQLRQQVH